MRIGRYSMIALWLTTAIPASASDQYGTVNFYASDNNGGPYAFSVSGSRTTKPACATDDSWSIPGPTTDNAKALYAGVMTSKVGGRNIQVVGAGVCDPTSSTREKVQYILFY